MRLKYLCIIVFLIWVCIFIALLPAYRISAILEALDFSDKNLTQRELVELNLKDYLKKLHCLDNYPQIASIKMKKIYGDISLDLIAKNDKNLAVLNRMETYNYVFLDMNTGFY